MNLACRSHVAKFSRMQMTWLYSFVVMPIFNLIACSSPHETLRNKDDYITSFENNNINVIIKIM